MEIRVTHSRKRGRLCQEAMEQDQWEKEKCRAVPAGAVRAVAAAEAAVLVEAAAVRLGSACARNAARAQRTNAVCPAPASNARSAGPP